MNTSRTMAGSSRGSLPIASVRLVDRVADVATTKDADGRRNTTFKAAAGEVTDFNFGAFYSLGSGKAAAHDGDQDDRSPDGGAQLRRRTIMTPAILPITESVSRV